MIRGRLPKIEEVSKASNMIEKKDEQSSFSYHFTNLVSTNALPASTNINKMQFDVNINFKVSYRKVNLKSTI